MKPLLSWQAPEYVYRHKHPDWYWAVGIIAGAAAAIAFLNDNDLFAAFLVLAGVVLMVYGRRSPRVISFAITDDGVQAGQSLYPWARIKGFIFQTIGGAEALLFYLDRTLGAELVIPITADMEGAAREILESKKIPEGPQPRRLLDIIMDLLGI